MPTLFLRSHKKVIDLKDSGASCSTLLIPESLIEKLPSVFPISSTKNGKKFLDFRLGLKLLLQKYRGFLAIGNLPFAAKPKLIYQKEGLSLQVFKFRPDNDDWFELGILAYGLGVSRCWLFSYLLELELSGLGDFLALKEAKIGLTTPMISQPRMIQQIIGKRRYISRILHFRI
jgi:hypothetical protein